MAHSPTDSDAGTRVCARCGVEKPLARFWPSHMSPGGRAASCIDCVMEARAQAAREWQARADARLQDETARAVEQEKQERARRLAEGWVDMGGYLRRPLDVVAGVLFGLPGVIYAQPESTHYIYALIDPRTGARRYVGRTAHPRKRLQRHISERAKDWIKDLHAVGLAPTMEVLEVVTPERIAGAYYGEASGKEAEDAPRYQAYINEREARWILHGIQSGWELSNSEAQDAPLCSVVRALPLPLLTTALEDADAWRPYLPRLIELAAWWRERDKQIRRIITRISSEMPRDTPREALREALRETLPARVAALDIPFPLPASGL